MIKFNLDLKIDKNFSLNKIYANCHWSVRKRDADYIHSLVKYSLIKNNIKPELFENPVELFFYFNTKLDISNTAYLAKLIEDALKGILIKDDSKKYVNAIHLEFLENQSGAIIVIKEKEV